MMSPDDFRRLAAAGLTTEQIAIVMEMMAREAANVAEAEEARKAKARGRVQRWRERNATETLPKVTERLTGDRVARVEDKSQTTEIEPQKENKTPRAALEAVLDADRANAVIEHRQRIRKPLTGHAATLLAGKFAQCPDPNAAADTMVGNGWQGFEPGWMSRPAARGSPPLKPKGMQAMFGEMREVMENGQADDGGSDGPPRAPVLSLPYRRTG